MIPIEETINPYFNDFSKYISGFLNSFISEVTENPLAWLFLGIWYAAATIFFILYLVTKNKEYILYGFMGYLLGTLIIVYAIYVL
jgi:hypothetical protein